MALSSGGGGTYQNSYYPWEQGYYGKTGGRQPISTLGQKKRSYYKAKATGAPKNGTRKKTAAQKDGTLGLSNKNISRYRSPVTVLGVPDIPNKPYIPSGPTGGGGGGGSVGGGGGGGSTSTATVKAPTFPGMPANDQYDSILSQMQDLYARYGDLGYNYQPSYFDYGEFDPDEEEYTRQARERMGYETAARNPIWNEQENALLRNYQAAIDAANQEQALGIQGVRTNADAEAGRLANMMANTGMGAGRGALQEKFGIDQAFANQESAIASQYGMQRAQAALEKANQLGGIGAEKASYMGGLEGQVRDIASQEEADAYNKFLQERGFQYQNYSDSESRRYQNYSDMYTSMQNQLNNQMGVLQNMAGLSQDQRDYLASWLTKKYEADWAKYTNNQQWTGLSAADQASLDLSNRTLNFEMSDAQRAYELQKEELDRLSRNPVSLSPNGYPWSGGNPVSNMPIR